MLSHTIAGGCHTSQSHTWMGWEARPGPEARFVGEPAVWPTAGRRALEHQGADPPCYSKTVLFSGRSPSDPLDR